MPFIRSLQFVKQNTVVRQDPLGHARLNDLAANTEGVMDSALTEHLTTGVHNALEVPFLVGQVDYPTVYGLSGSTWYDSVTNPATGEVHVVGSTALRIATGGSVLLNVTADQVANVPHIATWQLASTYEVVVRLWYLTSALGAGNSWAAATRAFNLAVHTTPADAQLSELATPHAFQKRDYLSSDTTQADPQWDTIVGNQETLRGLLLAEHTSAGEHNTPRIARAAAWVDSAGGLVRQQGVTSAAYISTGIYDVTLSTTMAANSLWCFPQVMPSAIGDLVIAHARVTSTTTARVYVYAYSGGNWARADRAFFMSAFGVPA